MTLEQLLAAVADGALPHAAPPLIEALWRDARGEWEAAHAIAQAQPGADGAWLHAYLHRKEGDTGNAAYWYRRAGRPAAAGPLEEEWRALAAAFTATPS